MSTLAKMLRMLKFPRKEERRKEKETEGGEEEGKKAREEGKEGERNKERKIKGYNGVVYWERRRKCVKMNEGSGLATRKKNIF